VGASVRIPARVAVIGSSRWLCGRAVFAWLRELRRRGLRPRVVVLDRDVNREHFYIVRLLRRGEPLLNVMAGNGATKPERAAWSRARREHERAA
jgi:hypothetical protein